MKKQTNNSKDIKPDLKHDNMEFTASTDGDEVMDTDDPTYEEEGITADELDLIEDEPDNEAIALTVAQTDRLADEDDLPEEDWTDDLADDDEPEEEEHHRK